MPLVGFIVPGRQGAAVLLPESVVQSDQVGTYVFILDGNDRTVRRDVAIGRVSRRGVPIQRGLTGDERVVLAAAPFLSPGQQVLPDAQRPPR